MNSTSKSETGDGANGKIGGRETLNHIVGVCRLAAKQGNVGVLSTGESLVAAIVLNRADWLAEMDYTITEALDRLGGEWVSQLSAARKVLDDDANAALVVAEGMAKARVRPVPKAAKDDGEPTIIDYDGTLVTYGEAPGYRDVYLTVDLREIDGTLDGHKFRASIRLNAGDSGDVAQHILRVHGFAWSTARGPIDKKEGEKRPAWLNR